MAIDKPILFSKILTNQRLLNLCFLQSRDDLKIKVQLTMTTSAVNKKCQILTAIYLYITLYIRVTGGERRRRESSESTSLLDYQTEFAQVTIRRIQLSHFVDLSGIMMSQCGQVLPQRV